GTVLATVLSLLAVAAHSERFVETYPASSRIGSVDGRVLVHASGFLAPSPARTAEGAARNFLSLHGPAFGVAAPQELVLRQAPAAGQVGAVRLARTIGALPVFVRDVVLG